MQVILKANIAPAVDSLDPVIVDAGGSVQVQVVANDEDDDINSLKYVLENAPDGMLVSDAGLIEWSVPNQAWDAVHNVMVIVLDSDNAMDKQGLEVSVNANILPAIETLAPVSVKAGEALEVQVVADDVDGDNAELKYHLADAPRVCRSRVRG